MKISPQVIPLDDIRFECLKNVLRVEESSGLVTFESFSIVLEWFGPIEISPVGGSPFLENIHSLFQQKYFHGFISTGTAEKLLNKVIVENQKKLIKEDAAGTHLVRFSNSEPGSYSLSLINKKFEIQHFRILHKAGTKYKMGSTEYDTLEDLLNHCGKLIGINLKKPSIPTPFETMLSKFSKKVTLSGYVVPDDD